jgi:hypothetical protein
MRIGTWNLAGKWDRLEHRHELLLLKQNCDVWLLTEVSELLALPGYEHHTTTETMAKRRRWAAILSRAPLIGHDDPHRASALAQVGDMFFCSSILPWRSCGGLPTWIGARHADKTHSAVDQLMTVLPKNKLVWGGDWNHAIMGKEFSGSHEGRAHITKAAALLGLKIPTEHLPHRILGLLSIDHIAVGASVNVVSAERIDATGLSDHDAYVIEIA